MNKLIISLLLINSFLFVSCGVGSNSDSSKSIIVSGSSSVSPLMFKLAEKFEEANSNYSVTVETSDSTIGVSDTINGNNDIGMASRNLKENEAPELDAYLLCQDGIVIIANKDSSITQISEEELYNLYINNAAIGSISKAISREDGSGTRSAFTDLTLIGKETPLPATVEILDGTGKVKTAVNSDSSKLGYISLGSVDDTIKPLLYKAKSQSEYAAPSVENIKSDTYKLYRPFYIFTKKGKEISEGARAFLDFIDSDVGKRVINENGYVAN